MPNSTEEIRCECCGVPSDLSPLTVTYAKDVTTILCAPCERLIDAGMLRPETIDGRLRYRQWHFQPMTPGDLLPDSTA